MEVVAAGKLVQRGHGAKDCLVSPSDKPVTPELIQKLKQRTNPDVGETRCYFITAPVKEMAHGKKSKDSLNADELLNPQPQTLLQAKLASLDEIVYSSHVQKPLGRSAPSCGLPSKIDPVEEIFGRKNDKGDSAGELVSPPKSWSQVEEESSIGRDLYRKSHKDMEVGEMIDRDYDWSKFSKESQYGVPTPHDNSGKEVRLVMDWQKCGLVISKQLDDHREKSQPQLGRVHDPIADSLNVAPDHTFGVMVPADEYSAGQLLHSTGPSVYLEYGQFDKGIMASIRNHLKKHNYFDFDYLLDALNKQSPGGGYVSREVVQKTLFEFRVPLEPEMLQLLLVWCSRDDGVDCKLLVQIMNWKLQEIDTGLVEVAVNSNTTTTQSNSDAAETLVKQYNYKTTSQQSQAVTGGIQTRDYRTFGVPTIRSDRPAPRIRRVADGTNYGDESDAHGLMYPSMYTSSGVYEQDFFIPRTPEQIRQIFSAIGVKLSDGDFKRYWERAADKDKNGQVCVESFREVLEETQKRSHK